MVVEQRHALSFFLWRLCIVVVTREYRIDGLCAHCAPRRAFRITRSPCAQRISLHEELPFRSPRRPTAIYGWIAISMASDRLNGIL